MLQGHCAASMDKLITKALLGVLAQKTAYKLKREPWIASELFDFYVDTNITLVELLKDALIDMEFISKLISTNSFSPPTSFGGSWAMIHPQTSNKNQPVLGIILS